MNEWISVEDRLPCEPPISRGLTDEEIQIILDRGENYFDCIQFPTEIFCAAGKTVGAGEFIYKMVNNAWAPKFSFKNIITIGNKEITHWMPRIPLPEPPE